MRLMLTLSLKYEQNNIIDIVQFIYFFSNYRFYLFSVLYVLLLSAILSQIDFI